MPLIIRTGTSADAAALAEFAARTFREAFAADNRPEDMALHLATFYSPATQLAELLDPAICTLLAESGGRLAGFAQVRTGPVPACVTGPEPIELGRFYVDRPWHGRGVAPALMQRAVEEASRRGGLTFWLGVFERNARARAFYEKQGFVDVGTQFFMVGTDRQRDRVMVRALPGGNSPESKGGRPHPPSNPQ